MKTVKDKQILMGADFAGYPLKEAIKEYLEKKGWTVTDVGVKADSDPNDTELMFHRIGLRVGAMITEKEFERALIFCGTGMGIHIAASKSVWRSAADRAFAYIERGPLTTWNWESQFEDVQPHPPYQALTKHDACSTAIYLVYRFPGDARRLAQARELLRFAEDQFVYWEKPCRMDGTGFRDHTTAPKNLLGWTSDYLHWFVLGVGEQYGWEMPIDASSTKLIRTYLALYKASGNPLDLAKARVLGDAMTNIQKEDGSIRTQWLMRPDADNFWINCLGASIEALELLDEEGE